MNILQELADSKPNTEQFNNIIPFPKKKYQIIYADPPWSYKDKA